ncbi:MAG: TetR family transcriptional regulator [Ramlibacter sp.]|nr:TetR family transcriptional regulator [Ramlibacter sp.]
MTTASLPGPPSSSKCSPRADAIIAGVRRLLARGFDAMTVDEVAAAVGRAKAESLYKRFPYGKTAAAAWCTPCAALSRSGADPAGRLGAAKAARHGTPLDVQLQLAGENRRCPTQKLVAPAPPCWAAATTLDALMER